MANIIGIEDFEAIFDQYKDFVYKTAFFIVGNHQKAEDIMQEVFVNAYRSRATYDPEKGKYSSWLRRITVNQCFRERRGNESIPSSIEEMEEKGQYLPDKSKPIIESIALIDEIKNLFNSLSAKYRIALVLRCIDGLTYNEISEVLELPLGTVKSRINRAITDLRERRKQIDKDSAQL